MHNLSRWQVSLQSILGPIHFHGLDSASTWETASFPLSPQPFGKVINAICLQDLQHAKLNHWWVSLQDKDMDLRHFKSWHHNHPSPHLTFNIFAYCQFAGWFGRLLIKGRNIPPPAKPAAPPETHHKSCSVLSDVTLDNCVSVEPYILHEWAQTGI